jgi:hypothetical protein
MKTLAALVAAACTLASCSLAPSDAVIRELAKDPATVCLHLHGVYGIGNATGSFYRTNITNGSVRCKDGVLEVESRGSGVDRVAP